MTIFCHPTYLLFYFQKNCTHVERNTRKRLHGHSLRPISDSRCARPCINSVTKNVKKMYYLFHTFVACLQAQFTYDKRDSCTWNKALLQLRDKILSSAAVTLLSCRLVEPSRDKENCTEWRHRFSKVATCKFARRIPHGGHQFLYKIDDCAYIVHEI